MRTALLLFLGFIICYGCVQSLGSQQYSLDYLSNVERIPVSDPSQLAECKIGSCHAMVCENGTNIFGPLDSYIGGHCYFEKNCTQERFNELAGPSTPTLKIRPFMIGQGPTFSDFAEAQTYCYYGLGMAVRWLIGTETEGYEMPDTQNAVCLLSKDVIPVYLLYSEGKNIDIERSRDIAVHLAEDGAFITDGRLSDGPVGPVIVVTEVDFDKSLVTLVADQVRAINEGCENVRTGNDQRINCLVAVAPKFNDFEALDAIMNEPGIKDQVDFVAYGINYKYAHSCEGPNIRQQAVNFSQYALYNHSKPTVIPYVLFDVAGKDVDDSCEWDENKMQNAYSEFLPIGIQSLHGAGVIGIAPYSFYSAEFGVTNPLNCTDCDLGKSEARRSSWFAGCQAFIEVSRGTDTKSSGGLLNIFPNESAGYCDYGYNADYIFRNINFGDAGGNNDFLNPQEPALQDPVDKLYSCGSCISQNLTADSTPPFDFGPITVGDPEQTLVEVETAEGVQQVSVCEAYPQIDAWSDRRGLDPSFVRAVIYGESSFQEGVAVEVCKAGYEDPICFQPGPGQDECYGKPAYDEMYDPSGKYDFEIAPGDPPNWRYCALGIMQSLEPPYTFWPASVHPDGTDGEYYDVFEDTGWSDDPSFVTNNLERAKECAGPDGKYNPFNASHSICMGTLKLYTRLDDAKEWINSHRSYLNWPGPDQDNYDYEKDNVFAYYIAANKYAGFWDSTARIGHPECSSTLTNGNCWAWRFWKSWQIDEDYCQIDEDDEDAELPDGCSDEGQPDTANCYGYTDFVKYVRDCEIEYLPRQVDPGAEKMKYYYWLINCPNSMCPEGLALLRAMEKEDLIPPSGNPYLPPEEPPEVDLPEE